MRAINQRLRGFDSISLSLIVCAASSRNHMRWASRKNAEEREKESKMEEESEAHDHEGST